MAADQIRISEVFPTGRAHSQESRKTNTGIFWDWPWQNLTEHLIDWVSDDQRPSCIICKQSFGFTLRKHHCRVCGEVVCDSCSRKKTILPTAKDIEMIRTCSNCWENSLPIGLSVQEEALVGPLSIVFVAIGTRGDIQPLIALAIACKNLGHNPVICTSDNFREFIESYGITFVETGVEKINQSKGWLTSRNMGDMMRASTEDFQTLFPLFVRSFYSTCIDYDADVIVPTSLALSFALDISEKLHIPCWSIKFVPDIPTRAFGPGGNSSRFGLINLFSHISHWYTIAKVANEVGLTDFENEFRTETLGLDPLTPARIFEISQIPSILAFSNTILPKPDDFPTHSFVTSFLYLDTSQDKLENIDPRVVDFVCNWGKESEAASTLVCVTFGSMSVVDESSIIAVSTRAALSQRHRVILITGWSNFDPQTAGIPLESRGRLMCVEELPHDWLFPYCVAVIHHGGAGTTARAAWCGVPSLIVPVLHWSDQPLWGRQLEALKAGAIVLDPTEQNISESLLEITRIETQRNAQELGDILKQEDGNGWSANILTSCLCRRMQYQSNTNFAMPNNSESATASEKEAELNTHSFDTRQELTESQDRQQNQIQGTIDSTVIRMCLRHCVSCHKLRKLWKKEQSTSLESNA